MRVAVIDTETTGAEETDQVCELALVTLDDPPRSETLLVKPTCPMTPMGRAAHHIRDEELVDARTMAELRERSRSILTRIAECEYVAAHFMDFDARLLAQSGYELTGKRICTWRCSMHVWPDAPRHSNQVLRYWLNLDVVMPKMPPHRALPDAVVTAAILGEMLKKHSLEELHAMTTAPLLLKTVRFGKHRGTEWSEVRRIDKGYLSWILKQDFGPDEKYTARHWLSKTTEEMETKDAEEAEQVLRVREESPRDLPAEGVGNSQGSAD